LTKASRFQAKWQEPAILKQMIQRYYRFMQLKVLNPPNILLIPTLDIEIVWQTHLLRPEMYRNDCLRLFRRIIDHSLIMKNDIEEFLKEQSRCCYSYWDETLFEFTSYAPSDYENPFLFTEGDIILDGK
jgi:hypothetical protein